MGYDQWYDKNKNNFFIKSVDFIWDNLIGFPSYKSRFMGFVRGYLYLYLSIADPLKVQQKMYDEFIYVLLGLFFVAQAIIGLFQAFGWFGRGANTTQEYLINMPDIPDSERSIEDKYPRIHDWFRLRERYMSGMTDSEKARFFLDTGGLTEESIKNMEKYPRTKDALIRMNHELMRPPKEQVSYMLGKDFDTWKKERKK